MSDTIIKVENLGKKYIIGHQSQQGGWKPNRGNYVALRDVVANSAKSIGKRLLGKERKPSYTTEEFWALKDINFEIKQGEVVGIIGRNGAGKSTLLKILSRITEPTTGRVELRGRVASLLEVGTGFHPELTGRENIYLNGSILGMSRIEIRKKFDEIVDFAEVEKFLDTPVKRYSSGMYVRLAFAVAAHLEPEILVVDEVLAVGDAAFQKKCLGKMEDVAAKEGRTVLFVSHNMPTIQALCPKTIWLNQGSIRMNSTTGQVLVKYLSEGSIQNKVEIDLRYHPRCSRSQEKAIKKVWIKDGNANRTTSVLMGSSVTVSFEFSCSREIHDPGFGFGFEDEYGRRIFSINNYMIGHFKDNIKVGTCDCKVPVIFLSGTYFVSISIVENQSSWIDFVEQAICFEVQPSDIYGTGKIPERSQGDIYIRDALLSISNTEVARS